MRKVLSFILVCAMLVGLMPMTFAQDAVRGENEWVFTRASHGKAADTLAYDLTNKVTAFPMDETVTSVSDKWEFVNQVGGSGYNIMSGYFHFYGTSSDVPNFSNPRSFVFELETDLNGTVSPSITVSKNSDGAKWEIYLIEKPANSEAWHCNTAVSGRDYGNLGNIGALTKTIDTKYRLGVIDAYSASAKVETDIFPEITVKPGRYYLVGIANGAHESWGKKYQMIDLVSFKMKNRALSDAVRYNYNISSDALASTAISEYGNNHTKNGAIDNGELIYISWELLDPSKHVALDLTKTDGYRLYPRQTTFNTSLSLHDAGVYNEFKLVWDAEKENPVYSYNSESIADRMHYMIKLNVPVGGKYNLALLNRYTQKSFDYQEDGSNSDYRVGNLNYMPCGAATTVYVINATEAGAIKFSNTWYYNGNRESAAQFDSRLTDANRLGIYKSGVLAADNNTPAVTKFDKTLDLAAGEYYVLFDLDKNSYNEQKSYWTRTSGSVKWFSQYFVISGIQLTPIDETDYDSVNDAYDAIVNVNPGNATEESVGSTISNVKLLCEADDSTIDAKEVNTGSKITCTAPEKSGYTFLYWAQGIGEYKKIVSYTKELDVKAEKGAMWLTAVYADDSASKTDVVFYNANGDELSRSQYNEGDAIVLRDLPSMAGFESASGWTLDTDGKTYVSSDEVAASGKLMRFVAAYPETPTETYDITVVGGTADKESATYGETVTVSTTIRENQNGAKLFNYWMRDGEIVSFDLSYSFKVWKDTEVTAVYKDYVPAAEAVRKIILGTRTVGTDTAIVAEFIGVDNAVEKGILFGTDLDNATHKVAMSENGDAFTVIDDVTGDGIGYAILANGKVIYSK
ncbi:MAG: InlB B-repeat-containing protein [Oscillospiraceae bacterium]|nr:InlB B-repeat-containing protein [Oscillospiraceae bacterium]